MTSSAAATTPGGRAAYEKSFTALGPELHTRYSRSVSYEFTTPGNSGNWFLQLVKADGNPQRNTASFDSPSFDGGRWMITSKISAAAEEAASNLETYLKPVAASWEVYKCRDAMFKLEILEPVGHKIVWSAKGTHMYDADNWNGYGWEIELAKLRISSEIANKGQLLIRWEVIEFADSNRHGFLPASKITIDNLLETYCILTESRPDVRFLFKGGKVVYGHAEALKKRSAYFATLLVNSYDEATPRTVAEAMLVFPSASPLDNPEDSDIESTTSVAQRDSFKDDKMGTVIITDFSPTTYKAFIIWLQTGVISFLPLSTSGGQRATRVQAEQTRLGPSIVRYSASPKSIYRLADKYGEDELKKLAHDKIIDGIRPWEALEELGSTFTSLFPSFIPVLEQYIKEHYLEIVNSPCAQLGIDKIQEREDTKEIWLAILRSTAAGTAAARARS